LTEECLLGSIVLTQKGIPGSILLIQDRMHTNSVCMQVVAKTKQKRHNGQAGRLGRESAVPPWRGGELNKCHPQSPPRLRGAGEITSLQHDGVVMVLSQGMTPTDACAALTEVCTAALGYAQPVEEKPFQFDPGESEDDRDSVADVDAL
jgi:hypothetical protein